MHDGVKKINEETSPGLFALIRCLDPICEFIGEKPLDFIRNQLYSCKKLYSRIIPTRINDLAEKIKKFQTIIEKEQKSKQQYELNKDSKPTNIVKPIENIPTKTMEIQKINQPKKPMQRPIKKVIYDDFDSWNFKSNDKNPITHNKNLLKLLVSSCLSDLDKMDSNTLSFMVDLLIPAKYKSFVSDYNLKEMVTFYGKKVATLSNTEVEGIFKNFILAGDNFLKYFSDKSIDIYFPKYIAAGGLAFRIHNDSKIYNSLFDFAKLVNKYYSIKNDYSTRYESLKANKYLANYTKKYNELNESKIF